MANDTEKPEAVDPDIVNVDPFCPVRLTQIRNRGRLTDKYMVELQKPDSDEWVDVPGVSAVHSSNYRLVPNAEVHAMAADVMDQTGLKFEPVPTWGKGHSRGLVWNGKQYLERWFTKDVKVKTPQGSEVMLGLEVRNSYDGHCNVGLAFFAMHCACSNQFFAQNLFGKPFDFSHIGERGELQENISDALAQLKSKANNFGHILPTIELLTKTRMKSVEDFLAVRKKLINTTGLEFRDRQILDELTGIGITTKVGIKVGEAYGSADSFWAVANAFTAITTHGVGGLRGQEQSTRATDFFIEEARTRAGLSPRMIAA